MWELFKFILGLIGITLYFVIVFAISPVFGWISVVFIAITTFVACLYYFRKGKSPDEIAARRKKGDYGIHGDPVNNVSINRPWDYNGMALKLHVTIDGVECFSLKNDECKRLKLENGKHTIGFSKWGMKPAELEVEIEEGTRLQIECTNKFTKLVAEIL